MDGTLSPSLIFLKLQLRDNVIHPKYYKHLKKGGTKAIWADKKWAGLNFQVNLKCFSRKKLDK